MRLDQSPLSNKSKSRAFILLLFCTSMGMAEDFVNQDRGFSFTIPSGWLKGGPSDNNPDLSASIYFPSKGSKESLTVEVSEFSESAEYEFPQQSFPIQLAEKIQKKTPHLEFSPPERTEVAGYPAWKLKAESKNPVLMERFESWIVLYRRQFFVINWIAIDSNAHSEDIKTVLESFQFIDDALQGEEYKSALLGFAFVASKGWIPSTPKEKGRSAMLLFVPNDDFKETFRIDVVPASVNAKKMFLSDRYLSLLRDGLRGTDPSVKMLSGGRLTLDGVKAWSYTTEEKVNGNVIHGKYWQVINNDRVYTMTWKYKDGSLREPQVDRMVKSFRFVTPTR